MSMVKKLFLDKNGRVVIAQRPNLPLIVWVIASVLLLTPVPEVMVNLLTVVAFGSWFTWAWLELFQGSCPFRKLLGAVVMGALLVMNL
jgi:hypothetical protein